MKKILLPIITVGLMTVSAMGADGTVENIMIKNDGTIKMVLKKSIDSSLMERTIAGTPEANNAMLATLLTAKTTNAIVDAYSDGTNWTKIYYK